MEESFISTFIVDEVNSSRGKSMVDVPSDVLSPYVERTVEEFQRGQYGGNMVEMVEEQQHGAGGGREEEEGKRGNTRIVMHNGALARSRRSDGLSRGPVEIQPTGILSTNKYNLKGSTSEIGPRYGELAERKTEWKRRGRIVQMI
ncbi:hypothetical protein K0M31_007523 [Melipona bicolor]|uniref:Uncharacterized protein n=1 Tax=Melipona bicolor TaxID=60889 RepID=A0AA40KVR5_9HYME|nr:hypothetical protein K0M31_007523 [Melipona bicolor]